jgi:hypothetical protein
MENKKKLSLDELSVESFVTSVRDNADELQGGVAAGCGTWVLCTAIGCKTLAIDPDCPVLSNTHSGVCLVEEPLPADPTDGPL